MYKRQSIGIPLLINSWFDDTTKGKALGLAFAGSGLGNIFLQQMTAYSLVNFGSSKSYLMFGALSLIVGIPVSLLFLRMPKNNSCLLYTSQIVFAYYFPPFVILIYII